MPTPHWAEQAKIRMKELGIKQEDLQELFNVTTRGAVGHYFTGRSVIDIEQLQKLSQKLNMHLDYMEPNIRASIGQGKAIEIPCTVDELKNSITDGVFSALQVNAISLQGNVKISSVAEIITREVAENANFSSNIKKQKAN